MNRLNTSFILFGVEKRRGSWIKRRDVLIVVLGPVASSLPLGKHLLRTNGSLQLHPQAQARFDQGQLLIVSQCLTQHS